MLNLTNLGKILFLTVVLEDLNGICLVFLDYDSRILCLSDKFGFGDSCRMVRKLSPMLFRVDLNLAWLAGACLMVPLNSMLIQSE